MSVRSAQASSSLNADAMSRERQASLDFVLAGRTLFRFRFRAVVYPKAFNEAPCNESQFPREEFGSTNVVLLSAWPIAHRLRTLCITRRVIRYLPSQEPRHYIDLRNDFPACISRMSRSMQRGLRHKRSVFERSNSDGVFFREYQSPEEIRSFYSLSRDVSKLTYQERLHNGLPDTDEFRNELSALAEIGAVRGFVIFQENRPVAFLYFRCFDDYVTAERCGFDPGVARLSPGTVLLVCAIEALAETGKYRLLDFGPGDIPYKASLATGSVLCADVFYLKPTARYIGIVLLHYVFNKTTGAIGKVFEWFHLRNRLKQWVQSF